MPATAARAVPFLAALLVAGGAGPAAAQRDGYPVKIEDAVVGLPPGRFGGDKDVATQKSTPVLKRGRWAPIALRLEMLREYQGAVLVRVEAADGDELRTTLTLPLAASLNGQLPGSKLAASDFAYTPYVRCGDRGGEVTITIVSADERPKTLSEPYRVRFQQFRDSSSYVVLSLGSRLPGFDLPADGGPAGTRAGLRNGRVETSAITTVAEMPDQWFGYEACDLVVLTTGATPPQFLADLFGENVQEAQRARRDALLEWVRRGGKLLVSVGSNAPTLAQYKAFQALLPLPIAADPPTRSVTRLAFEARSGGAAGGGVLRAKNDADTAFPVANFGPPAGRPARVLSPVPDPKRPRDKAADPPVIAQVPLGLGRVTVVGFDLDQSPFLDYTNRAAFWDYLLREAGSARAALPPPSGGSPNNFNQDAEDEWLATLRGHVDTFDGVPVVSFGWVALFIALYTLLIGPVEYLFLKYVLKRLELTWVTFPLIVVSVSAAAYFTAYAIKGDDLKVNKVDLVDIDLAGGRVYGRSWFTVFSPRIDSYTVGVEPRQGWAVADPALPAPLVGWMAGGSGGGGGSILGRGYSYHTSVSGRGVTVADGLERVPIQVWATKAFTASWVGAVDKGTPPVAADLYHPPGNPDLVAGSFVSNLPVGTLDDPRLIYAGQAYILPPITPGQRVEVPAGTLKKDDTWFEREASMNVVGNQYNQPAYQRNRYQSMAPRGITNLNIWGALFHERAVRSGPLANSSLRNLDLSWRVDEAAGKRYPDEAILVASVRPPAGPAEQILTDPQGPSATTLWLKNLPGSGQPRVPVPGTLRQETFVRVIIPIRPAAAK